MNVDLDRFKHGSFVTIGSTLASYLLILGVMFVVLFVIPFLVFYAL